MAEISTHLSKLVDEAINSIPADVKSYGVGMQLLSNGIHLRTDIFGKPLPLEDEKGNPVQPGKMLERNMHALEEHAARVICGGDIFELRRTIENGALGVPLVNRTLIEKRNRDAQKNSMTQLIVMRKNE